MPGCGACCFLGDYDLPVVEEMLRKPEDVSLYLDMIGADGWCVHFDKTSRACKTYDDRPRFCRVELSVFKDLYGTTSVSEMNEFAIACCEDHIENIFPALADEDSVSDEMARFQMIIASDANREACGD
jgi:uncharacterized protein